MIGEELLRKLSIKSVYDLEKLVSSQNEKFIRKGYLCEEMLLTILIKIS